jgi:anaerobic nitric oxide reductase transcription regulator
VLTRAALRASGGRRGEPVTIDAARLQLDSATDAAVEPPGAVSTAAGLAAAAAPEPATAGAVRVRPLREAVEDYKRAVIQQALTESEGNWSRAAELLALDRGNLHRLGQRLGLK